MINNDINNSTIEPGFIAFSTTELFTALGQAHENWNSFSEFKQSAHRVGDVLHYEDAMRHVPEMSDEAKAFAVNPNSKGIFIYRELEHALRRCVSKWNAFSADEKQHWAEEQAKPNHVRFEISNEIRNLGFESENEYEDFLEAEYYYSVYFQMWLSYEIETD